MRKKDNVTPMIFLLVSLSIPPAREWRKRRVYQLLTDRFAAFEQDRKPCTNVGQLYSYCGGTFAAVASKLDYIKNMGYNAIWISPTVEQTEDNKTAYHGYWFSDLFATNKWFGTDADLKNLIAEAHKRDIWVMADVVYNHMGYCSGGKMDLSCIKTFPEEQHYHKYCDIQNWNDEWQLMNCRLAGLPDLDQENAFVKKTLLNWTTWYMNEFQFDGVRIDTVKHVQHEFWRELRKISPWYQLGEIWDLNISLLKSFTNDQELYSTMNYPMQNDIKFIMGGSNSFWDMHTHFEQMQEAFGDRQHDLGVFFENHDNQRFLWDHNDVIKYEAALILIHTWIGIPINYYGAEQDLTGSFDPDCRRPLWNYGYNESAPRYKLIQKLNKLREKLPFDTMDQREIQLDDHHYAFWRGNRVLVVLNNLGSNSWAQNFRIRSPFNANSQVCDYLTGECQNVNQDGTVNVEMRNGQCRIYIMEKDMQ